MKREEKEKMINELSGKGLKETEEKLYRQLGTMERNDLIDLVISYMSDEAKLNFVEEWDNY